MTGHRITWWVWAGRERIRRTRMMRGTWGYDASCSCGWQTNTGGAVERYVRDEVWLHKRLAANEPSCTCGATSPSLFQHERTCALNERES